MSLLGVNFALDELCIQLKIFVKLSFSDNNK